jgi:HAE1 family hydrophobic/amphiphilic exporter-1
MTALATIFALTPMALGLTGGGGFISQPLAVVVIGGLFSSTILTLVIVPVLYWLVEGRKERKALRAKRATKAAAKATKAAKPAKPAKPAKAN